MVFGGLQDKAEHSEDLIHITLNSILISGFTLLALISEVYHLGRYIIISGCGTEV